MVNYVKKKLSNYLLEKNPTTHILIKSS